MLEVLNLNNVLSVNFGCKEIRDAVLWPVGVAINFAMIVEEVTALMDLVNMQGKNCLFQFSEDPIIEIVEDDHCIFYFLQIYYKTWKNDYKNI